MKRISLTQGKYALVDNEDFARISKHKWCFGNGYAVRWKSICMHREIINFPKMEIDHINRNKLDNRKFNLKVCSHGENLRNRCFSSSGHNGIYWEKSRNKYQVRIEFGGKNLNLGRFRSVSEALKVRNQFLSSI